MPLAPLPVLLLLLTACTRQEPRPPLRVAVNVWPGYDTLWLADQLGFTAAEGVSVRILTTDGLGASRRLFKLHEADLFGGTLVELIASSLSNGRDPRAVALLDISLGPDVILGRPGLSDFADLRGRRVGIEPGTSDVLLLAAALRARGLAPGDVQEVHVSHQSKLDALRSGRVEAVCSYPPESEATMLATGARVLLSSADVPGKIIDVLIAGADTIRNRAGEIAALLRANQRAVAALRNDPAARRLLARRRQRGRAHAPAGRDRVARPGEPAGPFRTRRLGACRHRRSGARAARLRRPDAGNSRGQPVGTRDAA